MMVNLDLRSFGSSVGLVVWHLGFCPKYRKKLFAHGQIKERFLGLCRVVEERGFGTKLWVLVFLDD